LFSGSIPINSNKKPEMASDSNRMCVVNVIQTVSMGHTASLKQDGGQYYGRRQDYQLVYVPSAHHFNLLSNSDRPVRLTGTPATFSDTHVIHPAVA